MPTPYPPKVIDALYNRPEPAPVEHRADTDAKKEECMRRLLGVWKQHPQLRLGQLLEISKSYPPKGLSVPHSLFYIEDLTLVACAENYDLGTKDDA